MQHASSRNNRDRPPTPWAWTAHLVGAFLACCIGGMVWVTSYAIDRTPPFVRLYGHLIPDKVLPGDFVQVRYIVTKRVRPTDACPGQLQQEIVDSEKTIISKAVRETGPSKWEPHPDNTHLEVFTGHPVQIPIGMAPGPAIFRTATFRLCNQFQYIMRWPIVQVGPDLPFTILDPGPTAK